MKKCLISLMVLFLAVGAFGATYTPASYEGTTTAITGSNSVAVVEVGHVIRKSVLTVSDVSLVIDGSGGIGWGTAQLGVFPAGRILVLGVTVDSMDIATNAVELAAADEGDFSLGTTATTDLTIDGTDVNLCPSTGIIVGTAADSALAADMQADGTTTAVPIHANFIIDDDDVGTGSYTNTFDAVVTITYVNLGDY